MSTSIFFQQPETVGDFLPFIYMPIRTVCDSVGFLISWIYELIRIGDFPSGDLI